MSATKPDFEHTSIVIFGASGDLTHRKLIPALFNNYCKDRLPDDFQILGTSRTEYSHEAFRQKLRDGIGLLPMECDEESWQSFSKHIWYQRGDVKAGEDYRALDKFLKDIEAPSANRLYYLATSPAIFPQIIESLGSEGLAEETSGWRKIVIEKPFGRDLDSALALNEVVHRVFREDQVYRIDHYLGKETAQNILYFRFLNSIFEPIWNRNHIDHVQITVSETVDVEHRAGYYDQAGVMRDMFQNHILQLLSLVAMEPPAAFDADDVRNEKVKVLSAVRCQGIKDTLLAQYDGYCSAKGVKDGSQTPTYAAMKLFIDNWRWQGVPFYLRSGKALQEKTSEVVIEFKPPPHIMFPLPDDYRLTPNFLSLCIQPDEGIHLRFETKVPDTPQETRSVDMEFKYRTTFAEDRIPDAYERLLIDAFNGDASLFTRSDEIEAAWAIVDPVIQGWEQMEEAPPLASYIPGSWGPQEADEFISRDQRQWRLGCDG